MIIMHETGNDGFMLRNFFPGFLHVISDVHTQLGGDISPFWWVLGSLRFQVSSIFICQHKDCRFSQLGKYCLRCGSVDLHFCSLLCRPYRWQARDFLNSSRFKLIPFLVVNYVCLNSRMSILGSPLFYAHTSMYLWFPSSRLHWVKYTLSRDNCCGRMDLMNLIRVIE